LINKKNIISILGQSNDIYIYLILKYLLKNNIVPNVIFLEKTNTRKLVKNNIFRKICFKIEEATFYNLSIFDIFYWKKFFLQKRRFYKGNYYRNNFSDFSEHSIINLADKYNIEIVYYKDINSAKVFKYLDKNNQDIGIFAGVGIVSSEIIDKFQKYCLNSHPGELPKYRGGGIVEQALANNDIPASSVHYATAQIDAGDIIRTISLKDIDGSDTIISINFKMMVLCAQNMADSLNIILNNPYTKTQKNDNSKMFFWNDCTRSIQVKSEQNLKKIINDKCNIAK